MVRASLALGLAVFSLPALADARVVGIDVRPGAERIDVVVRANEPLTFQSWARSAPPVLVVDLMDAGADATVLTPAVGALEKIEVTRHDARGVALSRVSLHLKQTVDYDVTARGNDITISLFVAGKKEANFKSTKPTALALNTGRGVSSDVPLGGVVEGSIGRATSDIDIAQAGERRAMTYIGF
jgi:hypothetical protein